MATIAKPLTHCPVCRYDLTGLPETHTCPECGFEYEESMRTWSHRPGKLMVAFIVFLSLYAIFALIRAIRGTWIYFLFNHVIFVGMAIWFIRGFLSRPCLVMSDDGLYMQQRKSEKIVFYPWSEIRLTPGAIADTKTPRTLWGLMTTDLTPYTNFYHVSKERKIRKRIILPIGYASRNDRKGVYQEIYERWQQAVQANDAEVT